MPWNAGEARCQSLRSLKKGIRPYPSLESCIQLIGYKLATGNLRLGILEKNNVNHLRVKKEIFSSSYGQ